MKYWQPGAAAQAASQAAAEMLAVVVNAAAFIAT
jgi:hypothetical protein